MGRLANIRSYQRKLGFIAGAQWYVVSALSRREMIPATWAMQAPALKHPAHLRTGQSSDFDVFSQILIAEEYAFLDRLRLRTVIDLGANIGIASALILSKFPECSVLAVEPDPENCAMLRKNTAPYGNRCTVIEGAVWSSSGEVALDHAFGDGREWATAVREGNGVKAYSMAELLAQFGDCRIDLLKIDIEGSEIALFSGDTSWMSRVENLCIELHGPECEKAFRAGTPSYSWRESRSGEYVVCEGIRPIPSFG